MNLHRSIINLCMLTTIILLFSVKDSLLASLPLKFKSLAAILTWEQALPLMSTLPLYRISLVHIFEDLRINLYINEADLILPICICFLLPQIQIQMQILLGY